VTRPLDARIEVARGELVIGDLVVPMSVEGAADVWRVGGPGGPLLRSLGYGERTRLCALAATSVEPRASLAAAVVRAATVAAGEVDELIAQTAALLLCGAGDDGSSFSDTVLRVGRAAGWDLGQLMDAQAADVDRLAVALGATTQVADSGWNRLVFEAAGGDASVLAVRDRLADRLLARVDETALDLEEQTALLDGPPPSGERTVASAVASASLVGEHRTAAPLTASAADGSSHIAAPAAAGLRPALVISNRWSNRAASAPRARAADADPGGGSTLQADAPGSVALANAGPAAAAPAAPAGPIGSARGARGASGEVAGRARTSQPEAAPSTPQMRRDRLGLSVANRSMVPAAAGQSGVIGGPWPARAAALGTRTAEPQGAGAELSLERMASELADALASLLQDEADLRGVE